MIVDEGKVQRGGWAMVGEAGMGILIEVGEGRTCDKVVDYNSSRCGFLAFHMGEPRGVMSIEIAYYQAVAHM
jgi:hypothetical protein